jgi:hypothetical protein
MDVPCRFFYHHICEIQPLLVYKHASDYYLVPFLLSPLLLVSACALQLIDNGVSVSAEAVCLMCKTAVNLVLFCLHVETLYSEVSQMNRHMSCMIDRT